MRRRKEGSFVWFEDLTQEDFALMTKRCKEVLEQIKSAISIFSEKYTLKIENEGTAEVYVHIEEINLDIFPTPVYKRSLSLLKSKDKWEHAMKWGIQTWSYDPGVRYHRDGSGTPPSWDEVELETHADDYKVAGKAISWIALMKAEGIFERQREEKMVQELKESDELAEEFATKG